MKIRIIDITEKSTSQVEVEGPLEDVMASLEILGYIPPDYIQVNETAAETKNTTVH